MRDKSLLPTAISADGAGDEAYRSPELARRHTWIVLALSILVLVALLLRLHTAWHRVHASPDDLASRLVGDEPQYEGLAYALLQGSFFQSPARVPVYPLCIAATYYVLGERSPAKLLYVQAFVGAMTVVLTYLLARRLTGILPALGAAGMVVLNDSLIDHTRQIYTEVLYTPLLLVALLALLWAMRAPRLAHFAWAGTSMAVVTLCRPTSVLLPLILPLVLPWDWTLKQKGRALLAYGLAMAAVIAPWTYHNWRQYHRFLPLSVSVGALWQGSPEFYRLTQQHRNHLDIWAHELNSERNGGHDPLSIDGDQYFTRRGLQSIRDEPGVYAAYSLHKAAYLWFGNPAAEWGYFSLFDWQMLRQWYPYSSLKLLNMLMTRQLPLVAWAALMFLVVRGRVWPLLPLVVVCAYFTLVHMITWSEMRYSEPLHPLLAIIVMAAGAERFGSCAWKQSS